MLPPLRSASQKDDDLVSVPAKIDSIAGAEVDFVFGYPRSDGFDVRKMNNAAHTPKRNAIQPNWMALVPGF